MAAELSLLLNFLATYLQTDHVCIYIIPQLVILSSHFQVGWGASTRETVKKYSIKILASFLSIVQSARILIQGIYFDKGI